MPLEQGSPVRDDAHLDSLLANSAYSELLWETTGDESEDNSFATETSPGETEKEETSTCFTFNDMKLKVEDWPQLQPPDNLTREHFSVKVILFLRGISLLVTTPVTIDGLRCDHQ